MNYEEYCPERYTEIENYELAKADDFIGWDCHHRLGEHCFTKEELKRYGLYFGRTPAELIFLKSSEHSRLHNKDKVISEYTKSKISSSLMGHKVSEEARLKMSESHKGSLVSNETKKKISESEQGRIFTEEHRHKLSLANKGRKHSEESRKNMSNAHKGRHVSEETRKKISETLKLRNSRNII